MPRIRMTDADWRRQGEPLTCPHCDDNGGWTFIGDAQPNGAWSVIRCRECSGEIEVSQSWLDEHLCPGCDLCTDDLSAHITSELDRWEPGIAICSEAVEVAQAERDTW